jgi:lipopolysaccharide transport system ATP-binding protein
MTGFGVKVEQLAKEYRITAAAVPGRRRSPLHRFARERIWALDGIDFELEPGRTLAIIGRNGAGKSTLLKVLSRVTPPTRGRALIAGKVSSLLEVGTGFHPELSGRENVYMNGAVLGMRRREIAKKFDEIVAFSELERFIDTPVKRYSSGMNLRLAFSVAAHLDPDVLLVDEVLAVGDASFQAKCLGKMGQVTGAGRTVILVSHSMPTVTSLAQRVIWLDRGVIAADGQPPDVVPRYLSGAGILVGGDEVDLRARRRQRADAGEVRFAAARVLGPDGSLSGRLFEGEALTLEADLEATSPAELLEIRAYVKSSDGFRLFSILSGKRPATIRPGRFRVSTRIDPNPLRPGRYLVDLGAQTALPQDFVDEAIGFEIEPSLEGYDDPVLRGDTGRLRVDYGWSQPEAVESSAPEGREET